VAVLDWMLDSDPSIRWQVLRDLVDAPAEVVAAERARVATEGWGARLLALQGEDGQWEGGALFPAGWWESARDQNEGQPWTATAYSLVLLRDLGVDPRCDRVRRAVAQVSAHCRWEHAGQPFFAGEVEPCINGMVVALGAYFGQGGRCRRSARRRAAGGRRVELRGGKRFGSLVLQHHDPSPGRAVGARARNRWLGGIDRGSAPG
jgi:hypothetical protein